jgi:hypothetical protein
MNEFIIHACEQSLRFSTAKNWDSLSEKIKMQFSFNVGVMALGLELTKAEGYDALADVCLGKSSLNDFHKQVRILLKNKEIQISEENVARPF